MNGILNTLRLVLPLATAGAALLVRLRVGGVGFGAVLAALGGALLGAALVLLLESVALLGRSETVGHGRRLWPERERQLAVALEALRLDAALGNLEPDEASRREDDLLCQLDGSGAMAAGEADQEHPFDREILAEAARRRAARGAQ